MCRKTLAGSTPVSPTFTRTLTSAYACQYTDGHLMVNGLFHACTPASLVNCHDSLSTALTGSLTLTSRLPIGKPAAVAWLPTKRAWLSTIKAYLCFLAANWHPVVQPVSL